MAIQSKETIKSYFETGDAPTQSDFEDFIDSYADTARPTLDKQLFTTGDKGQIYIGNREMTPNNLKLTDIGATWNEDTNVGSAKQWRSVSISSDGKYQTAVVYNGQIYISDDYGATWTAVDSARVWYSVSMSSDGRYQTAVVDNGQIWISKADELINGNLIADSFEGDGSKLTGIAPSPINLDYAFSLTPDVDDGLLRTTTLTGNVTLNAPTSPVAGAVWEWYVTADGTNRNLSLHVDIKIPSDSAFTSPKILTANKTYILQLRYVGSSWCLTSLVGGF